MLRKLLMRFDCPQGFECKRVFNLNKLGEAGGTEKSLLQPIAAVNGL